MNAVQSLRMKQGVPCMDAHLGSRAEPVHVKPVHGTLLLPPHARRRAVVAPHLVGAACHRDPSVAAQAVDTLRHLVGQLLSRAELSNFTHQVGLTCRVWMKRPTRSACRALAQL